MANKTQAKAVIDAAVVDMKDDIDNILPVGVNITKGSLEGAPTHYAFFLDAGGLQATADSWLASIQSALTTAGRTFQTLLRRRTVDGPRKYVVTEAKLTVHIANF